MCVSGGWGKLVRMGAGNTALCGQVMLEFPMDDAATGERQDALVEMSFYVPKEAEGFAGEGEDTSVKARLARACRFELITSAVCLSIR